MSSHDDAARASTADFLTGGKLGALLRDHDWSTSPLGPLETWPQSLRTTLQLMLGSRYPMCLGWGEALTFFYNDAYAPFLGARHPAALGRSVAEVWSDVWPDIEPLVERAMSGEATWSENAHLVMRRNGHEEDTWWTFSYSPVRDEDGAIVGFLDICSDSTANVLTQRRLREEHARVARMFEQAPGFMAMLLGPRHVFDLTNAAYMQLIGHRDVIGKPVREALPEVEGQGFFELLDDVLNGGQPYVGRAMPVELQRTRDAPVERRFVDFVYQPITDVNGVVAGIFVEGYDVTERVTAEAELRESEERDRRIVEGVKDHAIFTTDAEGSIVDWPPGAEAVFSWPAHEIRGKGVELLFTPEDRAAGEPSRELAIARETGCAVDERWHVRSDGSRFFANGSVRPLHNGNGELTGFIKIARDETARRAAEAAVRKSDERYRTLFEAIDAGFCIVEMKFDENGRAIDYRLAETNPAFEQQTGLYGAVGKWVSEAAPGLERHWFDTYGRVALTGEAVRFENYAEPFGRWYDVHAFRAGGAEERRVAILFNDISDRRRAELALRALNADLERQVVVRSHERGKLWQVSPDMLSVIDLESATFDAVNPAWTATLGWAADEIEGKPYADFVHPDDVDDSAAAFEQVRAGDPVLRFENRYGTKDGGWRWLSWVALPDGGKLYSTTRDVTAEKAQEAELVARTAELDRIWRISPDLLLIVSFDGVIRRVNPAWTAILGYEEHELVGTRIDQLVHPDDIERTEKALTDAAGGPLPVVENRYQHKDGSYRWLSWITAPPEDGMIYATGRHVTVEKERQAELEAAKDALRQSQKMEAIGQLTGGVAHDFNNLLTVIRSSADLLRRSEVSEEKRRRYVDAIADTADRAATLTSQLLAFARRQALKPEVFDAGARVNGIAEMLRSVLGARIELELDSGCDACFVEADPGQFETALVNLAVNARDAMGGEGRLAIATRQVNVAPAVRVRAGTAADFIAVSVADTGTGIPAALLERIFEPFFTTKATGTGTGLGLSQVFGFAKQSGGEIDVATEIGRGSTFTLYLPRTERRPCGEVAAHTDEAPARRGRVLVVEDNAQVGEFAAQLLEDLGYATELAPSATVALRLLELESGSFDVVFSDVVMPGLGGVEFGRRVRERWPELPVVLTSGYSHVLAEDARHGFPLLHKPYSVEDLSTILHRATAGSG